MMKRICIFTMLLCGIAFSEEKTLDQLEQENKMLEMQLKNEQLKKEIQNTQKSDKQKQQEAVQNAKDILEAVFKEPTKDEKRSGKFWGTGIGGMATTFEPSRNSQGQTSILVDAQGGGMTMWNRYFGVQYYANVDLGIVLDKDNSGWNALLSTYTFNVDAILNAYNSDSFGVGFLVGLGAGVKFDYTNWLSVLAGTNFGFDARFNLGMRLIFGSSYGLDFMVRFPFMEQETGIPGGKYRENASFSVRFVGGRF